MCPGLHIQADYRPSVDIFLPVCGESLAILDNTWKHVAALKYSGRLNVYVLDDAHSDEVSALAAQYRFHCIRRDDRPKLKKAGNLRYAFKQTVCIANGWETLASHGVLGM